MKAGRAVLTSSFLVQTTSRRLRRFRRHVDCEFEELGRPIPTRGGQPRRNALVATQDALHEFAARKSADDPQMSAMQKICLRC